MIYTVYDCMLCSYIQVTTREPDRQKTILCMKVSVTELSLEI
jgi:hypothetical protein